MLGQRSRGESYDGRGGGGWATTWAWWVARWGGGPRGGGVGGWWAPLVEVGWGAHWVGTIRTLGAALQSGPALPRATTVHVGAR